MTEADVASACDALATAAGWQVERYEQPRATRIQTGLPDRRYVKRGRHVLWVELKRPGGKLTREQHAWLEAELASGSLATCVDDAAQLLALLRTLGRGGSIARAEAHRTCAELVRLVAQRGFRAESAA